jgi:hypothetical protein
MPEKHAPERGETELYSAIRDFLKIIKSYQFEQLSETQGADASRGSCPTPSNGPGKLIIVNKTFFR